MKVNKVLSAVTALVLTTAAVMPASFLTDKASAEDNSVKYEFEDGKTEGGKIYANGDSDVDMSDWPEGTDLSGFSGKGFAYLDQKNTTVSVEVDMPEAGLYELTVCYAEPSDPRKKVQYLQINGVNQGELTCPYTLKFAETSGGVVNLKKGKNTIELKAYWGYTFFDYIKLKPASEKLTALSPTRELSNPNASDSTKRLYNYLCDVYGKHIIAGQQEYCGDHNYNLWNSPDVFIKDNEAEFEYIEKETGKQPAIRGIDFLAYNTSSDWRDHAPERAIEWTNKYHGIATCTWHWNVPCEKGSDDIAFYVESANPKFTTFSCKNAVTEGTWEHEKVMADLELIAGELKKLQDADVPILWRPLHEAEGAWFWWGAEGPEACKALYRLMYDELTNTYGLNNLIWIWTGSTSPEASEWYPGDDVVDIVGYDKYNAADGEPNLSSIASTFYSLVQSTDGEKMVAMTENDSIPSLENLVNDKAAWLYFCPWYMNYLTSEQNNPVDNLKEIYQSEYCITLDELPDLKTYPISGSSASNSPKPTEKTSPAPASQEPKVTETPAVTEPSATPAVTEPVPTSSPKETTSPKSEKLTKGDLDGSGTIDVTDLTTLSLYLLGDVKFTPEQEQAADIDGDEKIQLTDLAKLRQYLSKKIDKL